MEEIKQLSLVVPAYSQQRTIRKDIKNLNKALSDLGLNYEIIVVVDGKQDKTYNKARALSSKKVRVLGYKENKGKGYAIKYGIEKAKGDVIGFIDSGMDIDPTGISMLLNHMHWYKADIIVGSKLHPVSQVQYPITRKILSWGYRTLTKMLFGFVVRDTQAGIKFFKGKVAKEVFEKIQTNHFSFDVEVLALAYSLGYKRIYEAPIKLQFKAKNTSISNVKVLKTIGKMLVDTFAIYYRIKLKKEYE